MAGKAEITSSTEKGLLQTPKLYEYLMETSVYPREPEPLKELRAITSNHPRAIMGTSPDAGQLMALILKLINAKNTIEIGVFTGYSLLLTALTIPDDGKITAIDMNRSSYEIGLPIIEKSGVKHKINFIESEALPALDQLLEDPKKEESFDFAFVDADKVNYANYHEKLMKLVKHGGTIIYDNTLWGGTVAMPEESVPEFRLVSRVAAIEFNKYLADDTRVQISQVPDNFKLVTFVDADKINYASYHEKMMKLVRRGGTILYDNTLWGGMVAMSMPDESVPRFRLESKEAVIKFNKYLAHDTRVQISQVPVGDGITICRRL